MCNPLPLLVGKFVPSSHVRDSRSSNLESYESHIPAGRNLEASVRSRGKKGAGRTERDLIEAGLSEPAGWRGRLWGLGQRSVVRDPALAESDDDLGRPDLRTAGVIVGG